MANWVGFHGIVIEVPASASNWVVHDGSVFRIDVTTNKLYKGAQARSAAYKGTHGTDDFYKGSARTSVF